MPDMVMVFLTREYARSLGATTERSNQLAAFAWWLLPSMGLPLMLFLTRLNPLRTSRTKPGRRRSRSRCRGGVKNRPEPLGATTGGRAARRGSCGHPSPSGG
jgi:hypothetical protein